jgi:uncharacterized RDD family membrane protein YckC
MSLAQVRIQYADGRVEDRWLPAGTFVVGREVGDIVLNDVNASSRHAQLEVQPGRLVVTDLGSTNGTIDPAGLRLTAPFPLQPNQSVRIGGSSITLVQLAPPVAIAGGTQVMGAVPWQPPGAQPPAYAPPPPNPYGAPPAPPGYGPPPGPTGYGPPPGPAGYPQPGPGGYGPPPGPGGYAPAPGPGGYGPPPVAGGFGSPYAQGAGLPMGAVLAPNLGEVAPWGTRVLGFLVDYLMVVAVMFVLDGVAIGTFFAIGAIGATAGAANSDAGAALFSSLSSTLCCVMGIGFPLAALGVGVWNRAHLVSKRGYSIGQGVAKLRVIDATGKNLTFANALIRLLAQVGISMVPLAGVLDLLWPLWDPQRQTLHDKAIGSFVIIDRSRL